MNPVTQQGQSYEESASTDPTPHDPDPATVDSGPPSTGKKKGQSKRQRKRSSHNKNQNQDYGNGSQWRGGHFQGAGSPGMDCNQGMRYTQLSQRHGGGSSPHQSPNRGNNGRASPHLRMPHAQNYLQGPSSPLAIPGHHSPTMYQQSYTGSPRSPHASPHPHSPGYNEFFHGGPSYPGQGHSPRYDQGQGRRGRGGQNQGQHNRGERTPNSRNQRSGGHTPNQRRKMFEPYLDMEQVSHGLKRNEFIKGQLRINPKNYEDCYVPHPDGVSDVYICGLKDRNRALNGDLVAVQIFPKEEWKVLEDYVNANKEAVNALQKLSLKTEDSPAGKPGTSSGTANGQNTGTPSQNQAKGQHHTPGQGQNQNLTPVQGQTPGQKGRPQHTPKKRFTNVKDYVSETEKERVTKQLFADDEKVDDSKCSADTDLQKRVDALPTHMLLRTGKIVAIIEKKHSRASTGHIRLMADKNKNTALFAPIDHRLPRMMIPMEDCPRDFHERPNDHASTLFIARLTDWEEHSQYAKGRLARSLGEAGEIEPETEGILISYDVDYQEFDEEVLECLPKNVPWKIPETEFTYRRDLRNECVFTIDPATARDLDDALHVINLGDGIYEIGVHIADVSFFINDDTALDRVASRRSTSVYLVQKVVPMLPRLLCEELCSLNPGKDRLTFSVIWKMTEDGEILEEWFGRSVIRSCVKMSYDHAQGFIEEPDRKWTTDELPPITGGFSVETIKEKTLHLQAVAKNLRQKRFDSGALRLDQVKLSYTLDKDTGMPNGYYVYQQRESNKLIEEFMLLANMAVAHKIYKTYPSIALLRRHPPPQSRMMDDLEKTVRSLGLAIDVSSSKSLHESIQQAAGRSLEDLARVQILTVLCSKPMQNAKYFCTGCFDDEEIYRHYALNVPLYTHFTSPIRRYPDVMVHRLLAAALGYREAPQREKGDVQIQGDHCNDKKTNSKRVQELSSELFFAVFVKECGPLEERGMVMAVLDKAFDVLILKLGVVKRVYCEKLPLREYKYSKRHGRQQLTMVWEASSEHPHEVTQNINIFSQVDCVLAAAVEEPLKWTAIVTHPNDGSP